MWVPRFKTIPDRVTWAVMVWIFFNLLWLKFLENLVPVWVGTIIATALAVCLAVFSPGPRESAVDDDAGDGEGR